MCSVVRILVIEDEPKTAEAIRKGLQSEGYESEVAHSGETQECGGFCPHRDAQPRDLGQAARHQRGPCIGTKSETVGYADGDREPQESVQIPSRALRVASELPRDVRPS